MIVRMLEPKEVAALLSSSKRVNECLSESKVLWLHTLMQTNLKAKNACTQLQKRIETLESDDARYVALTKPEMEKEMTTLIDEYICKRKVLGESIFNIVRDCKSFIYTGKAADTNIGEVTQEAKPAEEASQSYGFFGAISGIFSFGAGETPKPAKKEDAESVLAEIVASEKTISPEGVNSTLTNVGRKLVVTSQEKMNKWIATLQKCFSNLYKSMLYFYCEAKDVEKLKDFMRIRFETTMRNLSEEKKKSGKLRDDYKNCKQVPLTTNEL